MRFLHLNMTWLYPECPEDWSKALPMSLVRRVKGLRFLDVRIKQYCMDFCRNPYDSSRRMTDEAVKTGNRDMQAECLLEFKVLPLERMTLVVDNASEKQEWNHTGRVKWAQRIQAKVLDPKGLEKYEAGRKNDPTMALWAE